MRLGVMPSTGFWPSPLRAMRPAAMRSRPANSTSVASAAVMTPPG
jgi:hypothetical protein